MDSFYSVYLVLGCNAPVHFYLLRTAHTNFWRPFFFIISLLIDAMKLDSNESYSVLHARVHRRQCTSTSALHTSLFFWVINYASCVHQSPPVSARIYIYIKQQENKIDQMKKAEYNMLRTHGTNLFSVQVGSHSHSTAKRG